MTRDDAIQIIAKHEISTMSQQYRESLLMDWWSIDSDDPEYVLLPKELKLELDQKTEPENVMMPYYEPLLQIAVKHTYKGVMNSFIEKKLKQIGYDEKIYGDMETLSRCPCCGYRTLQENGSYEICKVCFWEDDGTEELEKFSGPNKMTLQEGRSNFIRFGAVAKDALKYVLKDGKERFFKDDHN